MSMMMGGDGDGTYLSSSADVGFWILDVGGSSIAHARTHAFGMYLEEWMVYMP